MLFVSQAMNFEDVMLWRVLRHVEQGFYIDVGAAEWPDKSSATAFFYHQGWSGINITRNPEIFSVLLDQRVRDLCVLMKAPKNNEMAPVSDCCDHGQPSSVIEDRAWIINGHAGDGIDVASDRLSEVIEKNVPENQAIHFMILNRDGFDSQIVAGYDWSRFRPWIILVQSARKQSDTECSDHYSSILVTAGYQFVYADGYSRFYLEERWLIFSDLFKYPPNISDNFITVSQARADQARHHAESQVAALSADLSRVTSSWSWRLTAPLRGTFPLVTFMKSLLKRSGRTLTKTRLMHALVSRLKARYSPEAHSAELNHKQIKEERIASIVLMTLRELKDKK